MRFKIGDRVIFTQRMGKEPPHPEWEAVIVSAEVKNVDSGSHYYSYLIRYSNGEERWVLPMSIRIDNSWIRDKKIDIILSTLEY